jgi:hypothetical protein
VVYGTSKEQCSSEWTVAVSSKPDPSHNHSAPKISDMRLSFQCFLTTKRHITDHILESSELFQEHAKKQSLKQATQCKLKSSLLNIHGKSVFFFFYMCVTIILKFLTCFSTIKLNYNKYTEYCTPRNTLIVYHILV